MKINRQYEKRGPLYLPRYDFERPSPFERYKRKWHKPGAVIGIGTNGSVASYGAAVTASISPTNGNTLLAFLCIQSTTVTITTYQDNNLNNFTQDLNVIVGSHTHFFHHLSNVSGVTSVNVVLSSATYYGLLVLEVSGLKATPGDVFNPTGNASSANPNVFPSVTTLNANDIVVGSAYQTSNGTGMTTNGSWTALSVPDNIHGQNLSVAYQIVSSATSWTPQLTNASNITFSTVTGSYAGAAAAAAVPWGWQGQSDQPQDRVEIIGY